jgi:Peptidoglycan-binding protein, CsiV
MPPKSVGHSSVRRFRLSAANMLWFTLWFTLWLPSNILAAAPTKNEAAADARWFQVELILFSQQTERALNAEKWPDIEGIKLPDDLLTLHLPAPISIENNADSELDFDIITEIGATGAPLTLMTEGPVAYEILGEDSLQLTAMAKKIQRSRQREVLLHIAWQQPTDDRQHAQAIYFESDMDKTLAISQNPAEHGVIAEDVFKDIESTANTALDAHDERLAQPIVYASEKDVEIGPRSPQFTGTVTLSVERYLHFAVDLLYRRPVTQHHAIAIADLALWYDRPYPTLQEPQGPAYQQTEWQALRGFRFKESRRMRSKVVHYLDHPFMGAVVVITPVVLPESEENIQRTLPQNILSIPAKR